MKIAYCIPSIKNSGGMERVLSNKANYLAEQYDFDISIITMDSGEYVPYFSFSPKIRIFHLAIEQSVPLRQFSFLSPLFTLYNMRNYKKKLEKLLKDQKWNIVISMFAPEARFLWKIKDGSKKIVEIHFSKLGREMMNRSAGGMLADRIKNAYDSRIVRKYDKFVVLTKEDKIAWEKTDNICVIHNAYTSKSDQKASLTNPRAISVGRLVPQKNFQSLIDIWEKVAEKHPEWELNIFGNGEERDMLLEKISKKNLNDIIHIHNPTRQIDKEYLNSSVYLMTSIYEGMPMVLLEAMSLGIPCVSYSCPAGPSEIIEDGVNGFLIPIGNKSLFANRIIKLIENECFRKNMGKNALQSSSRFSEDIIMKQWKDMFNRLMQK